VGRAPQNHFSHVQTRVNTRNSFLLANGLFRAVHLGVGVFRKINASQILLKECEVL
jgi:hypothetical protein